MRRGVGSGVSLCMLALGLAACEQRGADTASSQPPTQNSAMASAADATRATGAILHGPAKIEDLLSAGYEVKGGAVVPSGGGAHIWLQNRSSLYYCYSIPQENSWNDVAQIQACQPVTSH